MSNKELERHLILKKVIDKKISQRKAGEILKILDRQIRNILNTFKSEGIKGLISKKRGQPSNRQINITFKKNVMAIVKERYEDFGPTLATEKLAEINSIYVSKETLRQWMIKERLWIPK